MFDSRISVCSLIICLILGIKVRAKSSNSIGNPNDVSMTDFPWHATATTTRNEPLCGAVIISDRHVLTSAGCLSYKNLDGMHVTVGSSTFEEGTKYGLKSTHIHPKYKSREESLLHDIAVIEIDGVITFNETQGPIALPDNDVPLPVGASVTLTGWGEKDVGSFSNQLRKQNLNIVKNTVCDEYIARIFGNKASTHMDASELCSLPARDTPYCQSNMGSGVVFGKSLVGIIFGETGPCGKERLEFITKVWEHVEWIREVTNLIQTE